MLNADFEQILRTHARSLDPGIGIDPDVSLTSLGIDSLNMVELVVKLEGKFDVDIPSDEITPEAFFTPGTIWRLLCQLNPELAASESSRLT